MDEVCVDFLRVYGKNIRTARESKQMTVQALAMSSGYNREDLSTMENGEHDIYLAHSIAIAEALNIDYPALLSRSFMDSQIQPQAFRSDEFLSIFVENAKRILKEKHRNQISFHARVGLDEATVSRIFTLKTRNPRLSTLQRIAEALECDIEGLMRRHNL